MQSKTLFLLHSCSITEVLFLGQAMECQGTDYGMPVPRSSFLTSTQVSISDLPQTLKAALVVNQCSLSNLAVKFYIERERSWQSHEFQHEIFTLATLINDFMQTHKLQTFTHEFANFIL